MTARMSTSHRGPWLGGRFNSQTGVGVGKRSQGEESSFLRVSTPSSVKDVGQRELETPCYLLFLGDPDFVVCCCCCKISKYLKSGLVVLNAILAKQNTHSQCLRKHSQLWQCCAAQIPLGQNAFEPPRAQKDGTYWCLHRKLETETKGRTTKIKNPEGRSVPF